MRTITAGKLRAFRTELRSVFDAPSTQRLRRTLTTPGGAIPNAEILWRPDIGLWAYFRRQPYDDRRWLCWYGLDPGEEGRSLRPAIEINLHFDPAAKQVSGRALTDPLTGDFWLGHRGGLGGGRGGQMKIDDFARQIRGFARDVIQLGEDREEEVFVIGRLAAPDFLEQLHADVSECERLRELARAGKSANSPVGGVDGDFRPECDQDGFQQRSAAEVRMIRRRHGRIVNALKVELGARAINRSFARMRPDLYFAGPSETMTTLFEVKASSDTQSWFTALGQLVVYGAGQPKPPRRVLVCPTPLRDPAFGMALKALGVRLVTFKEDKKGGFAFEGLAAALK